MTVLRDVLRETRLLTVLLGIIMLLAPFEQAILPRIVVLGNLGGIVPCP
jgi:hypothetical protein